jgi:hypothetical protein
VPLVSKFIPAADEVGRLQSGKDAECRLFQKVAEQGHYAGRTRPSSTRQGTYATTADGLLLTSWNNNNPRVVAGKLREALEKWERLKAEGRKPSGEVRLDASRLERADRFYPKGGLVLRVNTRDLPRETPQEGRWADAWNQDFAWFTKDEARRFLPESPEPGQTHEVPRALVERLARFHLLDNVRGQTSPFPARAIQEASLTSRITEVDGDVVVLRLEGRTRAAQEGRWSTRGYRDMERPSPQERGLETQLLGFARFDLREGRFVSLEVVAVGSRWGGTQYNGRGNDPGPAPFGVVLSLAGDARSDRVEPEHFWGYGWR